MSRRGCGLCSRVVPSYLAAAGFTRMSKVHLDPALQANGASSLRMTREPAKTSRRPIRVAFVVHVMQVAGAEVLVTETVRRNAGLIEPVIFCLDKVGQLGEQLQAEGVPVVCFNRKRGRDLGVAWRMARAIREHGIEVLHAHQYTPFFYSALARVF